MFIFQSLKNNVRIAEKLLKERVNFQFYYNLYKSSSLKFCLKTEINFYNSFYNLNFVCKYKNN